MKTDCIMLTQDDAPSQHVVVVETALAERSAMPIEHVNRCGNTYYLHEGNTKTGKPKFFFSRKKDGTLAEAIPPGFEVYENPDGQVFLRKIVPRIVTDEEITMVERGVREFARLTYFLVDVKGKDIIVYLPGEDPAHLEEILFSKFGLLGAGRFLNLERSMRYLPMMRFTLVDEDTREFAVARWCFKGSIDDWWPLFSGRGDLQTLVARYCSHLGQESFYELS
jgi:hypothetical protein